MSQGLKQVVKYHAFCCSTQRPPGHPRGSCGERGAGDLAGYFWEKVMGLELADVRVATSSCLGVCDKGPAMVVYPEGAWYTFQSKEDVDEIVQTHFIGGKVVERLLINPA